MQAWNAVQVDNRVRTATSLSAADYSSFAEWLFSTNRYRTPHVIRQQATLVVAAISGLILLDVASNTAWDVSNDGVRSFTP